jgi:hypothetical protein
MPPLAQMWYRAHSRQGATGWANRTVSGDTLTTGPSMAMCGTISVPYTVSDTLYVPTWRDSPRRLRGRRGLHLPPRLGK